MASTISAGTTAGTAVAITGDTSGNLALLTQNGANIITVPNGTGTMAVNGVSSNIVAGAAVASTSGTSINFTSIPNWVKRITIMFSGVSTSGASHIIVQIGNGAIATTGYAGSSSYVSSVGITNYYTQGFGIYLAGGAASLTSGTMVISNVSSNTWVSSGTTGDPAQGSTFGGGNKALAGVLDRVRITTVNGTDTFDAGSINILYE